MNPQMETAVLEYISAIMGTVVDDLLTLKNGIFFKKVLTQLDFNVIGQLRDNCCEKDIFHHLSAFLSDNYNNSSDILDFNILLSNGEESETERVKLELAKVTVALLCVGILDKNGHSFTDAALQLPIDVQDDILTIIQSILTPDLKEMSLTKEVENVLMGTTETQQRCDTPVMDLMKDAGVMNGSVSGTPCDKQSKGDGRRGHLSMLNCSQGDLSSPFKNLDITTSSPSSFVEFVQSPQLVQKAVLKQRDFELRKLRQHLNSETVMKEEYRLIAEEMQALNKGKDEEIIKLQQRISELLAEREELPSLKEMALKFQEASDEAERLKERIVSLLHSKSQCEALEAENKSLTEELRYMQKELSNMNIKHQAQLEQLSAMETLEKQLEYQTTQVKELTAIRDQLEREKNDLNTCMTATMKNLVSYKQHIADLEAKLEEEATSQGESMGVVLDIQLRELKNQLEVVCQERDALKRQLEKSEADIVAKEEQVHHKVALWNQAWEANQVASQALALERDTVVKMKTRMEAYVTRCQDLTVKLEQATVNNTASESQLEKVQADLKETKELLQECQEELAEVKNQLPSVKPHSTCEDFKQEASSEPNEASIDSKCVEKEMSKLYRKMNSAPVLSRRQGSTVSLQSIQSMAEQHSVLLPNAMSCATEPESPQFEWNSLSLLKNKDKIVKIDENKRPKRKGLSHLPENTPPHPSQGSPAKQKRKSGSTTTYFPLDPNGPVYPPVEHTWISTSQKLSPSYSESKRTSTISLIPMPSSSTKSLPSSSSMTSLVQRPSVSKYTPAKKAGRRFHLRSQVKPSIFDMK